MTSKNQNEDSNSNSHPRTIKDLNKLTKKELKRLCGELKLKSSGNRSDLFDRLKEYFGFEPIDSKDKKIESDERKSPEIEDAESDKKDYGDQTAEKEIENSTSEEAPRSEVDSIFNKLNELNISRDSRNDLIEILKGYNSLQQEFSDNEYILIHKGICLQYQQEYNNAIEYYEKALKINPYNLEARILLEGCRVLEAIRSSKQVVSTKEIEISAKPTESETVLPVDESEQVADEDKISVEEKPVDSDNIDNIEEGETLETESAVQIDEKQSSQDSSLEKQGEESPYGSVLTEDTVKEETKDEKPESMLGEELAGLDTKTLTESKSRLSSVLQELKSELGKKPDQSADGKEKLTDGSDMKPVEYETQSLKDILDDRKADDDFGSKILSSARKLLTMTEGFSDETIEAELQSKPAQKSTVEISTKMSEPLHKTDKGIIDEIYDSAIVARPKPKVPSKQRRIRTGNISLDKLLQGGFDSGSNILIDGPPFVGKDIFLYKFATLGFRMNTPCIIINPDTAPRTIRDRFNLLLGDILDYENKNLIYWLDPESEEIKNEFNRKKPTELPDIQQLILDGLKHYGSDIRAESETYNLIFFSITPLVMFQEPKVLNKFLSSITKIVKEDNAVGMYTIDNSMPEQRDLNFVKRVMDGILEIKQDAAESDQRSPKNFFKIDKLPHAGSYEWHEFKYSDKNFEIKEIRTYNTVM
jgi:KaiC/GvpD/RAD55 family RecA-like ATPase